MTTGATPSGRAALFVRAGVALLVAVVLLGTIRSIVESRRTFAWGVEAEEMGDWESAVLHYRHALQWYAPFGARTAQSFDRLVAIGQQREEAGDVEGALVAYRSARHAVMAVRHFTTPLEDRLRPLHTRIGTLMATQTGNPADAARFTAQLNDWESRRPDPRLAAGASLAFFAWLLSLGMLAWRSFTPGGEIVTRALLRWSGASVASLALWLICLRLA